MAGKWNKITQPPIKLKDSTFFFSIPYKIHREHFYSLGVLRVSIILFLTNYCGMCLLILCIRNARNIYDSTHKMFYYKCSLRNIKLLFVFLILHVYYSNLNDLKHKSK